MSPEMAGFADFTIDMGANIIAHKQRTGEPITQRDRRLIGEPLWTVTAKRSFAPSSTQDVSNRRERQDQERRERANQLADKLEALGEKFLENDDIGLETLLPPPLE